MFALRRNDARRKSTPRNTRSLLAVLVFALCLIASNYSITSYASTSNTRADTWGTLELAGNNASNMGGAGVDIYSNGPSVSYTPDKPNNTVNVNGTGVVSGEKWQCVELINRLYLTKGWTTSTWNGNGDQIYSNAPSGLTKEANGLITSVSPGDVLSLDNNDDNVGHTSVISSVSGGTITIINQNTPNVYSAATFANGTISLTGGWTTYGVIGIIHHPGGPNTTPSPRLSDYNGDGFSDLALLHQTSGGGADIHDFVGSSSPLSNSGTWLRSLAYTSGWDWSKMKVVTGDFNGNGYADLAILHQRTDGGADLHVMYGGPGSSPLGNTTTITRSMPGTSGWDWSKMKIAAADYNGDTFSDIAIMHQTYDGGADLHLLFGATSTPLNNSGTWLRSLPYSSGWDWSKMKLTAADYNGNSYADLAILHQRTDGGADLHVMYGGPGSSPLGNTTTITRSMPGTSGWDWSKMKLTGGDFNGDSYSDIALLHQVPDGGADIHILFGSFGSPLNNSGTWLRSLPYSSGWDWSKMKIAVGDFNGNAYDDFAIIHQRTDSGADIHLLYGGPGSAPLGNTTTLTRGLPWANGWNWSQMNLATPNDR